MVNTELLEKWILESGKKKSYLASKCGLSRQGFMLKCKGINDFTSKEIKVLCIELSITKLSDKEGIFLQTRCTKMYTTQGGVYMMIGERIK